MLRRLRNARLERVFVAGLVRDSSGEHAGSGPGRLTVAQVMAAVERARCAECVGRHRLR
ncbi:hypothetical protein ACWDKQ_01895 [Saccharopolyspora sp. NPDC000995]